ncbi:hypothetical protein KC19_3G129700 [Ceratodon purpureus]|uniref:Uncharacterized protein n=1 Tax=Ceratodon purpureus TaxID=3225 RepID=A0A8T0IHT7_CERPU|nr:hypothetical protein KC19_3G129700 [Ceratodon purpureus]
MHALVTANEPLYHHPPPHPNQHLHSTLLTPTQREKNGSDRNQNTPLFSPHMHKKPNLSPKNSPLLPHTHNQLPKCTTPPQTPPKPTPLPPPTHRSQQKKKIKTPRLKLSLTQLNSTLRIRDDNSNQNV